ncbi:MAG TPA: hypothetical protein VKU40_06300, partial [Thermoanaerobaculia bacterium]|nr:hypothetical protein [Thermoanaerobaculia bacterium]
ADELVRRGERVAEVAARLAAAEAALGELPAVDEAALERLEALHAEVERLGAAREAASPLLELTARRGLELTVEGDGAADGEADGVADGSAAALAEGEGWQARPAAPVRLRLDDASGAVAELSVVPGGDVAELSRRLTAARQGLADGCAALAVDDLAAAREVAKRRREAASAVASARAALAEASGGEAAERYAERREQAAREAAELAERLRVAVAEAGLEAGDLDDVDEDEGEGGEAVGPRQLEEALAAAGERLAAAAERARRVRGNRDELRRRLETSRNTERELAVEQRNAAERHRRARQRAEGLLRWQEEPGETVEAPAGDGVSAGAAAATPPSDQLGLFAAVAEGGAEQTDDGAPPPLTAALDAAGERLAAAMTALDAARRDLARAEPAAVERRLQAAEAERRRLVAELRAGEDERIEVRARLEAAGESDLYESLERARGRWAAARSAATSVEARAAAARRLHEALSAAREAARRAYSEPLRKTIEELGAGVFGDGFAIELDDELRVARRTVGGVTLDTPRLSTGAREQLSLLSRLACAVLVAPGGGVPLVLDDALGNTDRRRTRAMAEVLARAGECCQVLVLTSEPERYQDVRGVHEIDLVT